MAIIKQHDKRSGITYVYESTSYWDKEKGMSRAKRKLIGKLNLETGEVVPTDGRNRKPKNKVGDEPDYKALYEKLLKKCVSQEELIKLLKAKLAKFEKEV